MSYKKQPFVLVLFIIVIISSFYWYGCSSESEKEGVKEQTKIVQVEKTYNFLDKLGSAKIITPDADYVRVLETGFAINNDEREVLFEHPNSEMIFKDISINEDTELKFGIGINQSAWDKLGDGVLFEVTVVDERSEKNVIFSRYIDPKNNEEDRKWFDNNIDLKAFAGQKVSFIFTTAVGPKCDGLYDWAAWSSPQIVPYDKISGVEKSRTNLTISPDEDKTEKSVETIIVDFGSKLDRNRLLQGWYDEEKVQDGITFALSQGSTSKVQITISEITNKAVYLRCHSAVYLGCHSSALKQKIKVWVNDKPLTVLELVENRWAEYNFTIPASDLQSVSNILTFEYEYVKSPVAFDYIEIKPATTHKITVLPRPNKQRPNVIVYLLDALRADHLGTYGYNRPTSPNIDKLAEEGILFENAFSQAPYTLASVASFFTSKYPTFMNKKGRLTDEYITIAEVLKEAGYQTAALSATPFVSKLYGTIQGFDQFVDIPISAELNDSARTISKKLPPILEKFSKSKKPFFLYIHSVNPHSPYKPPSPYFNAFRNAYRRPVDSSNENLLNNTVTGKITLSTVDKDDLIAQYDGNILFNDHEIGNLMKMLKELNLVKNTVVVIMSDHGEEFFDHGRVLHGGRLFDEQIHIPLIFWNPTIFSQPQRISTPVELVDLMPTLINLTLTQEPDFLEMEGTSLLHLLEEGRSEPKEIYSYEPELDAVAIRNLKWKYIHSPKGMWYGTGKTDVVEWLFDLENDPHEIENKANKEGKLVNKFREQALEWLKAQKEKDLDNLVKTPEVMLDEATKERLKSLGYIQ